LEIPLPHMVPLFGGVEELIDSLIINIKKMFKRRHILCHEIGAINEISPPDPGIYLNATFEFLKTTESLIQKITPNNVATN